MSGLKAGGVYMYYFYILRSLKDKKLYYGSTIDLKERFKKHSRGRVSSTRDRRPLALIYYEAYTSEKLARQREKFVKISGRVRAELKKRLGLQ